MNKLTSHLTSRLDDLFDGRVCPSPRQVVKK